VKRPGFRCYFVLLLPVLLFHLPCSAQAVPPDFVSLNKRSEALRYENPPESARLALRVIRTGKKTPAAGTQTAAAWINLAYAMVETSNMDSAAMCIDSAEKRIMPLKIPALVSNWNVLKGYFLDEKNDIAGALQYYFKGLELCTESKTRGAIYNNIGVAYRRLKDYDNALKYYELAYEVGKTIGDTVRMAKSLNNTGSIWYNQLQFARARSYYEQSLRLREGMKDSVGILSSLNNIAMIYEEEKNYTGALAIHHRMLKSAHTRHHPLDIITSTINIGNLELKQHHEADALHWFNEALVISDSIKRFFYAVQIYQSLSRYYKSTGNYEKALSYLQQAMTVNDSVLQASSRENAQELEARFQNREKEKEIALLNEKNKVTSLEKTNAELQLRQKNNTLWLITALAVSILLLAGLLYYRNRAERKHSSQLAVMLDEKNVLLKEIHHRVKNNLQLVSSLLSLQSNNSEQEETSRLLKVSQDRIHSLALLHEKLYQSEQLKAISFSNYLSELAQYLGDSFNCRERQITIIVESADIAADIDQLVPCGLILNELITNSLKYAFPNDGPGEIRIRTTMNGTECSLHISDNGTGIPAQHTPGIGLKLVSGLVRQLKGKLQLLHPGTGGTAYEVTFPLHLYKPTKT
jgi:two-component sensor histidine kinase